MSTFCTKVHTKNHGDHNSAICPGDYRELTNVAKCEICLLLKDFPVGPKCDRDHGNKSYPDHPYRWCPGMGPYYCKC